MAIKCWYGPGGALMVNRPIEGMELCPLNDANAKFYTGKWLVAESMSQATARYIATALHLEWSTEPVVEEVKDNG